MHHHLGSAFGLIGAFLSVIIVGTFWRVAGLHLANSPKPLASKIGRTMLFQY